MTGRTPIPPERGPNASSSTLCRCCCGCHGADELFRIESASGNEPDSSYDHKRFFTVCNEITARNRKFLDPLLSRDRKGAVWKTAPLRSRLRLAFPFSSP